MWFFQRMILALALLYCGLVFHAFPARAALVQEQNVDIQPEAFSQQLHLKPHQFFQQKQQEVSWLSRPFQTGHVFNLVGFRQSSWQHNFQLRIKRANHRWSRWVRVPEGHHQGTSDPIWVGAADMFQLRKQGGARPLRVQAVLFAAHQAYKPQPHFIRAASMGYKQNPQPLSIIPRSTWDPLNECQPKATAGIGQVQVGFVHHTVSLNGYTPESVPGMILSICKYHRDTNGWNDIGYNFLVDTYGQIYEGRAGGIDKAVTGAQTSGFNSVSTGVAVIGDYMGQPVSNQALQSTANVLAWKLSLHGTPLADSVTLTSSSGEARTLQRISGHRDGSSTDCPGNTLYAQLPSLRQLALQSANQVTPQKPPTPASVSFVAQPVKGLFGGQVTLTGVVRQADSQPLENIRVSVLTADGNPFMGATTAADGTWKTTFTARQRQVLVAAVPGGVQSKRVTVEVGPNLVLQKPQKKLRVGKNIKITGQVTPAGLRGVKLEVARKQTNGSYRLVRRLPTTVRAQKLAAVMSLSRAGLYRLQFVTVKAAGLDRGTSKTVFLAIKSR